MWLVDFEGEAQLIFALTSHSVTGAMAGSEVKASALGSKEVCRQVDISLNQTLEGTGFLSCDVHAVGAGAILNFVSASVIQ